MHMLKTILSRTFVIEGYRQIIFQRSPNNLSNIDVLYRLNMRISFFSKLECETGMF